MIKIEQVAVWGFEHAIRGMRNPMNSWDKSDSFLCDGVGCFFEDCPKFDKIKGGCDSEHEFIFGKADLDLMNRLSKAGQPHRKFLRQIFVSVDITAPLYWWKEFDTYKVGTTANSQSTMHKITSKEFTVDDFSHDHMYDGALDALSDLILELNYDREQFLETKDKRFWYNIIQLLPSSYNQKRTVTMTYENLLNMLEYRKNHKLDEWRFFCEWILTLPLHEVLEVGVVHE